MAILNPFESSNAFNMASMTRAVNILPNMYDRLGRMGVFRARGIPTRSVIVEEYEGQLSLLPTTAVGAPGSLNERGTRTLRSFAVPFMALDESIAPEQYQGIRSFGTENRMETLTEIMNDRLQQMRNKFDITKEYMRMAALKGTLVDCYANTIYNYFTEFGVSQKTVDFDLDNATLVEVQEKCFEVSRHVEDYLQGESYTRLHCLCDSTFFDALITHDHVKEVFQGWARAEQVLGGDPRKGFTFAGITFEEYRGTASDPAGSARAFVDAGSGYVFPVGTMNVFEEIYAPADFLETANTNGLSLYAKQETRKFGRGVDIHMQSSPLMLNKRPNLVVKVTKT